MNKIFRLKFDKGSHELKVVSELATNAAASTDNQVEISHHDHVVDSYELDSCPSYPAVALPQITSQQAWHEHSVLWSCPPINTAALTQHIALQRDLVFTPATASSVGAVAQSVLAHAQTLTRKTPALALLPKSKALACAFVTGLMLATSLLGFSSTSALAHTNPQVVAGQAIINNLGTTTQIITSTEKTIINWDSFNIRADEIVDFVQRNSTSAVLNRVLGGEVSSILGRLQSNGNVFLINPNGIVFGKNAVVDVQNLIASTLNITDADFLADKLNFVANDKEATITSILNQGMLTVGKDGKLMLLGGNVVNNGVLKAEQGSVYLLAGQSIAISDLKNPSISYKLVAGNTALNLSEIFAAQKVQMTGNAVLNQGLIDASLGLAQRNQGVTSAQVDAQGVVELIAADARVAHSGANSTTTSADFTDLAPADFAPADSTEVAPSDATTQTQVYNEGLAIQAGKVTAQDIKVHAPNIIVGAQSQTTAVATASTGGKVEIGAPDYYQRQELSAQGEQLELARNLYVARGAQISAQSALDTSSSDTKLHVQPYQGAISLYGDQAYFGGTVQAQGGFVETSARQFTLDPEFKVLVQGGEWLLDPLDLRIVNATDGFFFTVDNTTGNKIPALRDNLDAQAETRKSSVSDLNGKDAVKTPTLQKAYNESTDTYREILGPFEGKETDQGLENLKTAAGLNGVVEKSSGDSTSDSLWNKLWNHIFGTESTSSSTTTTRLPQALNNFADVYKAIVYNVSVGNVGTGSTPVGSATPNLSLADNSKYYFYTIDYVNGYKANGTNTVTSNRISTKIYTTSLNSGYKTTSSNNLGTNALGTKNYTSFVSDAFLNQQLATNNVTLITDQGNISADKVAINSTSGNSLRLVTQEGKIKITDSNISLGALSHSNPGSMDSAFVNSVATTNVSGITVPTTNAAFGTKGHSILALVAPNGIELSNTSVKAATTSLVAQGNITIANSTLAGSLITKLGPKANIDDLWSAGLPRDLTAIYQARHAGDRDANVSLTIQDSTFALANGQHLNISNNYSTTLNNVTISGSSASEEATIAPKNYYNAVVSTDFSQAAGLGFSKLNTTGLTVKNGVQIKNELLVVTTKADQGSKASNGTVVRPAAAALTFVDNVTLDTSDRGYLAIHAVGKNQLAAVTATSSAIAHELSTVNSVAQGNPSLTIKGANQYLYALQQVDPVTVTTTDFREVGKLQTSRVSVIDFSNLELKLEKDASLRIATGIAKEANTTASSLSRIGADGLAANYVILGTSNLGHSEITRTNEIASTDGSVERPMVVIPSSSLTMTATSTSASTLASSVAVTAPTDSSLTVEHPIDIPEIPELSFGDAVAPVVPNAPVEVPNPSETVYAENVVPAVQARFGKITLGAQSKLGVYNHNLEAATANSMATGTTYAANQAVDFYFGDDVNVGESAQLRLLTAGALNLGKQQAQPVDVGVFGSPNVSPTHLTSGKGAALELMASSVNFNNVQAQLGSDLHLHGYLPTQEVHNSATPRQVFTTRDQLASDFIVNISNSTFSKDSNFTLALAPEGMSEAELKAASPSLVINNHATKGQVTIANSNLDNVNLKLQVANEMNMHWDKLQLQQATVEVVGIPADHQSYYEGLQHLYNDLHGSVDPSYNQVVARNTRGYGAITPVTDSKVNLTGSEVKLNASSLLMHDLGTLTLGSATTTKYGNTSGLSVALDEQSRAEFKLGSDKANSSALAVGNLEVAHTTFSGKAQELSMQATNLTFGEDVQLDAQALAFAAEQQLQQTHGDLSLNLVALDAASDLSKPATIGLSAGEKLQLQGKLTTNAKTLTLEAPEVVLTETSNIATNQANVVLGKSEAQGSILAQGKLNAANVALLQDTKFGDGKPHTANATTTSSSQWQVANVTAHGDLQLNGGHLVAQDVTVSGDLTTQAGNRLVAQNVEVAGTALLSDNTRAFLPKLHAQTVVVDNAQVTANEVSAETAVSAVNDALLATKHLAAPELVVNASAATAVNVLANAVQVSNTGTLVADKSIATHNLEVIGKDTLVRANNIEAQSVVVANGSLGVFQALNTAQLHAQNGHIAATNGKVTVSEQATFNKSLFEAQEFATKDVIAINRSDLRIIDLNATNLLDVRASKLISGNVTVGSANNHASLVNIENSNVNVANDAELYLENYQSSGNSLFSAGKTFRADIDDTLDIADNADHVAIGANDIVIKVKAYQAPKENLVVGTHSTNITCEVSNVMNCHNPQDVVIDMATQALLDSAFKIDLGAIFSAAGSSNSSDNTGASEKSSDDDGSDEEESATTQTPDQNQGAVSAGTPNNSTSTTSPTPAQGEAGKDNNTTTPRPVPQPTKPQVSPPKVTVRSGSRNQSVREQLGFQKVTTTPKPSVGSSNTGSTTTGGSSIPTPSVPNANEVVGKTTVKIPQPSAATLNKVVRAGVNSVALPYGSSDEQFEKLNQVNIQGIFSRLGQSPVANFQATQATLEATKESLKPTVPQSAKGTSVTMPAPKVLRPEDLRTIKLQTPEETPNLSTTTPNPTTILGTQRVQVLVERSTARDLSILNKAMPRLLEGQGFSECKFVNRGGVMSVCASPEDYPKVPVPARSKSKTVTPQVAPNPPVSSSNTTPVVPRGTISVPVSVPAGTGLTLPTSKK